MKPEIILFCSGGIVQSISANVDIKVYYLDNDILEDVMVEEDDDFDNRDYGSIDVKTTQKKWDSFKNKVKKAWNMDYNNALKESNR